VASGFRRRVSVARLLPIRPRLRGPCCVRILCDKLCGVHKLVCMSSYGCGWMGVTSKVEDGYRSGSDGRKYETLHVIKAQLLKYEASLAH